jgi:AmpD protein
MQINNSTGLLTDCTQCPSPNEDNRPDDIKINLVIIHSISLPPGRYGGNSIERFFQNKLDKKEHPYFEEIHTLKVSSHILIKRSGEIVQFVPFSKRAWHAGPSCYQGRESCNDFSIGIELEGTDTGAFEDIQYQQLSQLLSTLQLSYPDILNNITGHSDIAPGRKTDPGTGFDWNRLNTNVKPHD